MNKYEWQYRGGEITGSVFAESENDAYDKLYAQRPDLHTDMFEVGLDKKNIGIGRIFGHGGLLWDIREYVRACWSEQRLIAWRDYCEWRDS